jgi:hypothetical protein
MYRNKKKYSILVTACISLLATTPTHITGKIKKKAQWTIIVYMAADNDLKGFAARNIKQMSAIGSSDVLNIMVHLDIKTKENKKITRRYYVVKDKVPQINQNDPATQSMDSGDEKTLISCCTSAIQNYPAEHYALFFWNHGTGFIDPGTGRIINPLELFTVNPETHKLDLDRTIGFLDFIHSPDGLRGICWDDSTGNYLTNQKLDSALNTICSTALGHQKFDIIGFDACLMAGIEITNIIQKYARIMIASQEVELGAGWDYEKALSCFLNNNCPDAHSLATNIVHTYSKVTNDFTLSAVDLEKNALLEDKVSIIALLLTECLRKQKDGSVKKALKTCKSKHELQKAINDARALITTMVFANVAGPHLSQAKGISIYFPETGIHFSYHKTSFATHNAWLPFLNQYLLI